MPIVPQQTQKIIVNPAMPSVGVVNAGPMGPVGPTGPSEVNSIIDNGELVTKSAGALVPITRAELAADPEFEDKYLTQTDYTTDIANYVPKAVLTADGQLLTRASGLLVPVTRANLANDSAFTSKYEVKPEAWTAVSYENSWQNHGSPWAAAKYRKRGDMVDTRGFANNPQSGSANARIFTLPSGFRPTESLYLPATISISSVAYFAYIFVSTDGSFYNQYMTNGSVGWLAWCFSFSTV